MKTLIEKNISLINDKLTEIKYVQVVPITKNTSEYIYIYIYILMIIQQYINVTFTNILIQVCQLVLQGFQPLFSWSGWETSLNQFRPAHFHWFLNRFSIRCVDLCLHGITHSYLCEIRVLDFPHKFPSWKSNSSVTLLYFFNQELGHFDFKHCRQNHNLLLLQQLETGEKETFLFQRVLLEQNNVYSFSIFNFIFLEQKDCKFLSSNDIFCSYILGVHQMT